jgi:hypothetical protein
MSDKYQDFVSGLESPAFNGTAITPSDSIDLSITARAVFVGGGGNLRVMLAGGDTVTLNGVIAGMIYPLRVKRVMSTGTSATNLVGLS